MNLTQFSEEIANRIGVHDEQTRAELIANLADDLHVILAYLDQVVDVDATDIRPLIARVPDFIRRLREAVT